MKLIFASNNAHKLQELRQAVGDGMEIISLAESGIQQEIPEPYDTLRENAREKAVVIHRLTSANCFSEDTGLQVDALQGAPGVHSARYAGEPVSSIRNIEKLLRALQDVPNRTARFITIICLIWNEREYFFEGRCEGTIRTVPFGDAGFGYDSVFTPAGSEKTFAEMDGAAKNVYSHRRKAADQLIAFLKTQTNSLHGQS